MLEPLSHSSWLIPVAKEAYKSRAQIATSWERALTHIKGKKIEIAVTGLSGAGKTVLLDHLTGQAFHRGYKPPGRSRSLEKGKMPAKGLTPSPVRTRARAWRRYRKSLKQSIRWTA